MEDDGGDEKIEDGYIGSKSYSDRVQADGWRKERWGESEEQDEMEVTICIIQTH